MPRTEKYFIGPGLLSDIRQTITRVAGMPDRTSGVKTQVVHQEMMRRGGGGGGGQMKLGKVTAAWNKNSLKNVVVYSDGPPLGETTATPPEVIPSCVNKFIDVRAGRWVMIGKVNGRWYLISAEC
jgi:hypothetical protein